MTRVASTAVLIGAVIAVATLPGASAAETSPTAAAASVTPLPTGMAAPTAFGTRSAAVVVEYAAPVHGTLQVLRRFDPPATRYGPGHLGVDLALAADGRVLAAGAGVVRFAGSVAGRGVVVVQHADGVSTEYEPVRPIVRVGATVGRGQVLGTLWGEHRGCVRSCLHWGARRDGDYLDPLSLLQPLGPVRLVPWPRDG